MTLAQVLEGQFRGDIRFRGAAYLKAERVSITRNIKSIRTHNSRLIATFAIMPSKVVRRQMC